MCRTAARSESLPYHRMLKVLLVGLCVLGYEGLVHWTAVSGARSAGPLCSLVPLLLLGCWLIWRKSRAGGLTAVLVLLLALFAVLHSHSPLPDLHPLYPVPHIAVNLLLLWFFARTLRPGREPLVTQMARYEHDTLPPDIERYTRRLTWAWCIYFAGIALTSLLLFALAPLSTWSWFANLLNIPLLLLMFVAEYAYRLLRFPGFSHASFLTAIRAFRAMRRAAMIQSR
jgi:uncharacterized membrane protein